MTTRSAWESAATTVMADRLQRSRVTEAHTPSGARASRAGFLKLMQSYLKNEQRGFSLLFWPLRCQIPISLRNCFRASLNGAGRKYKSRSMAKPNGAPEWFRTAYRRGRGRRCSC